MDPTVWGPSTWKTIHAVAIEADRLHSKEHFEKFLYELAQILPCENCRGHMQAYLKTNPVPDSDFFLWTFQFHNAVNYRLGKPQLTFEDALKQWSTESCGKCSSPSKSENNNFTILFIILSVIILFYISYKYFV